MWPGKPSSVGQTTEFDFLPKLVTTLFGQESVHCRRIETPGRRQHTFPFSGSEFLPKLTILLQLQMGKRRHTHLSVDLSENCERFIPQKVKAQVNKNFVDANGLLCCPFLLIAFAKLGKRVTYAHIIPKSVQTILTKKQDVVHHPGNLVPTIDTIHEQMELHQMLPGFTLEYLSSHSDQSGKDVYAVRLAPHITGEHMLLKCGVFTGQAVTMPTASRQFWQIHKQVFDLCHQAKSNVSEPQHMQTMLNAVLSNLVVNHIALPTVQRLTAESLKQGRSSGTCSILSEQKPSFALACPSLLAVRRFELKATWWKCPIPWFKQEYYSIDILWCSRVARTFDIISLEDFKYRAEYDEIMRIYKGQYIEKFREMIYVITFDDLVKYLRPGTLSSLLSSKPPSDSCGITDADRADLLPQMDWLATSPGGAFSRKHQKRSSMSPAPKQQRKQRKSVPHPSVTKFTTPMTAKCIDVQPGKCNEARVRKRLHDKKTPGPPGFFRGGRVKVLANAKVHAGEIWVVDDIEHRLQGTRSIEYHIHLESQDGRERFQLLSAYLQPYAETAEGCTTEAIDQTVGKAAGEANNGAAEEVEDGIMEEVNGQRLELTAQGADHDVHDQSAIH